MENCLYIVDYPFRSEYAEANAKNPEYDFSKCHFCPQCGQRVSGGYWLRPREISLTRHKTPDFLYAYCYTVPFLISENAMIKIQEAGLKGIICAEEIDSVRFQRKSTKGLIPPKYYHIELARSRIVIDHEKSNINYGPIYDMKQCSLCRQVPTSYDFFRSLSFCMDEYEGYDIFQIYELGHTVFLSQKFVDFYIENKLTNLRYDPAKKHGQWAASYFLDGVEDKQ